MITWRFANITGLNRTKSERPSPNHQDDFFWGGGQNQLPSITPRPVVAVFASSGTWRIFGGVQKNAETRQWVEAHPATNGSSVGS